jgi:hypothetical protein
VDRHERARGQHRALHALLAAGEEGAEVGEVAEAGVVAGALGADGQRRADLGDDDPDLARGDLDPRVPVDREHRPEPEPQARHEHLGLVARLAPEGDGVVALQLAEGELLRDEADLRRPDAVHGLEHHGDDDQCRHCGSDQGCVHPIHSDPRDADLLSG